MAIVDFSELHVVESRAVLQKIHNAHGVCVSPAVFHGDFRGNVLQPCVERSEEHTSELQSLAYLVCRLLLEKKKKKLKTIITIITLKINSILSFKSTSLAIK